MRKGKEYALQALQRLPDDVSMAEILAKMEFVASVLRGLEQAERGEGITHAELIERVRRWHAGTSRNTEE